MVYDIYIRRYRQWTGSPNFIRLHPSRVNAGPSRSRCHGRQRRPSPYCICCSVDTETVFNIWEYRVIRYMAVVPDLYLLYVYIRQHFVCRICYAVSLELRYGFFLRIFGSTSFAAYTVAPRQSSTRLQLHYPIRRYMRALRHSYISYSEIYACLAALIHLLEACNAANKFAPHRLLASVTSFLYLQIGDAKTFALHSVSAYICTIIVEDG